MDWREVQLEFSKRQERHSETRGLLFLSISEGYAVGVDIETIDIETIFKCYIHSPQIPLPSVLLMTVYIQMMCGIILHVLYCFFYE